MREREAEVGELRARVAEAGDGGRERLAQVAEDAGP